MKKRFAEPGDIMAKVNESFDRYSQKERKELFDFFMLIQRQRPISDASIPLSYDDDSGAIGSSRNGKCYT